MIVVTMMSFQASAWTTPIYGGVLWHYGNIVNYNVHQSGDYVEVDLQFRTHVADIDPLLKDWKLLIRPNITINGVVTTLSQWPFSAFENLELQPNGKYGFITAFKPFNNPERVYLPQNSDPVTICANPSDSYVALNELTGNGYYEHRSGGSTPTVYGNSVNTVYWTQSGYCATFQRVGYDEPPVIEPEEPTPPNDPYVPSPPPPTPPFPGCDPANGQYASC